MQCQPTWRGSMLIKLLAKSMHKEAYDQFKIDTKL